MFLLISTLLISLAYTDPIVPKKVTTCSELLEDGPERLSFYGIKDPDRLVKIILKDTEAAASRLLQLAESSDRPTFENTILAISDGYIPTSIAFAIARNLKNVLPLEEFTFPMEEMYEAIAVSEKKIYGSKRLFERVKYVFSRIQDYDYPQQKIIKNIYQNFLDAGAGLSEEEIAKRTKLGIQHFKVGERFAELLSAGRASLSLYVEDVTELAGCSEQIIEQAKDNATEAGLPGCLLKSSDGTFWAAYNRAHSRNLRKKLYLKSESLFSEGDFATEPLIHEILSLRKEIAGFADSDTYAQHSLKNSMIETPEKARAFLKELMTASFQKAKEEYGLLETYAKENGIVSDTIHPWDLNYLMQLRRSQQEVPSQDQVREFFPFKFTLDAVLKHLEKLMHIKVTRLENVETWHKDVHVYEIHDTVSDHRLLGHIFWDPFNRKGKETSAYQVALRSQGRYQLSGITRDWRPVIALMTNNMPDQPNRPAGFSIYELETFVHEFGHALQELNSEVSHQSVSGTNVSRDFVEVASKLMELWLKNPAILQEMSSHHETNERIPLDIIEAIRAGGRAIRGMEILFDAKLALLDLEMHDRLEPLDGSLLDFERQILADYNLFDNPYQSAMVLAFSHIFSGGYASRYYSYAFSEALSKLIYSIFLQNGLYDKKTALRLRYMLSQGGSQPEPKIFQDFLGQDLDLNMLVEALLAD